MTINVELDESGKNIIIGAEWRYKELCKSIPGAKWDAKTNIWHMPVSWSGCLALRSTFRDDLEIGPRLGVWAAGEKLSRIDPSNALREVTNMEEGYQDLFPHQRAGVEFLATAKRALLADEPGLGKTAQAIRALSRLHEQGEDVFPALVVCPNTLKKNWEREFAQWWPGIRVQVIGGSAVQRRKQFDPLLNPEYEGPKPHVLVINWESLRTHSRLAPYGSVALARCTECDGLNGKVTPGRCEVHKRELNEIDFKSVIADEIHRSKDPKSKQTRALWAATGDAKIRFALTGTPIANNVLDLWTILHWLSPEEWPSKTRWIDRMVDTMMNAFGGIMVMGVKHHMSDEFYAALNPRMRRMLKKVVLPWLPEVTVERRDVEMSTKQKKAYNDMRDLMIAELEGGEVLSAPSVLTQTLRLLQFASAYATMEVNPKTGEPKALLSEPSCKIDALMDDISHGDFGEDSIAVSAVSRQLIELLSARLTKAGINHGLITGKQNADERQQAVDDFQSGRTKWILFTAQAGGVGITLTAARRLIRLQRPWSLVDDKQVNDRVHRIGSEIHDNIIITDYVTSGTVEERVRDVLEAKADSFEQIVKDQTQLLALLKEDKEGKL
jgi:SWI/SNF-related matrix-associated actin-dependent regulator 1 of chromatin subfamily A